MADGVKQMQGMREGRKGRLHRHQENARIPKIATIGQHLFCLHELRLLDEALEVDHLGPCGPDAEALQSVQPQPQELSAQGGTDGRAIRHHLIGGHDQQKGLGIVRPQMQHGGQNGRGGVLRRRLNQDQAGIDPDLGQLLGDDKAEIGTGDDDGTGDIRPRDPPGGGLKRVGHRSGS